MQMEYINFKELEKLLDLSEDELKQNYKRLVEEKATYFWNPNKGGKHIIVSDNGDYLGASSSISFDKLLEEYKNGRRNGKINESVFTNYAGMNSEEIKELIVRKISLLNNKIDGNIDEQEKLNEGYLLWNCKMILRNIYMSCDKLVNKFSEELTSDEREYYSKKSEAIKNAEKNCNSIEDIKKVFDLIK